VLDVPPMAPHGPGSCPSATARGSPDPSRASLVLQRWDGAGAGPWASSAHPPHPCGLSTR